MTDMNILAERVVPARGAERAVHDRIFVRDLVLDCHLGVYPEEQGVTQKVSFTVEADVATQVGSRHDQIAEVPSYDQLSDAVKDTLAEGHINLVETIAERVAARVLEDQRIVSVRVRIEKMERGPAGVGIDIIRPRRTAVGSGFSGRDA
jgi:dihydroneopterin aldolase